MRFSGHESFACRYAWLPKTLQAVVRKPDLFADEDAAMVELGVGKNMVRSMRFWAEAGGMILPSPSGQKPTPLGSSIFLDEGFDPFLEDLTTLWLIHWKLSTSPSPLLAWDFLLNRWQEAEFSESRVLPALDKEVQSLDRSASNVTLRQHLGIFLHTYIAVHVRRGDIAEDNLDCPLTELELIVKVGEREGRTGDGRREPVYAFRREEKVGISPALFAYCVNDFWSRRYAKEKTLHARVIANGHGSPGQIFKIPEQDVYHRLSEMNQVTAGGITYNESEALPQLRREIALDDERLLRKVYR